MVLDHGARREELELMPVPALIDWLETLRGVDARRRLAAFGENLAAARGDDEGVRAVERVLTEAGGVARPNGFAAAQRLFGWGG